MRGMGNMQGMMKQMQKMQKEMGSAQEALNQKEFTGVASGELVAIVMTGDKKVKDVVIKPEAVDPDDIEMLQDLILMATNDVLAKIEVETQSTMGKFTKGIPGL
ncbi:YbaB/EbfC family nucleoid-associated protein [Carnobacterium divergens]|uniref:YbaB/EbfC family nucleoid-associated protein n=1 Tax=Carnobacterium divergens TaxID=2748 RepID=UPI001071B299|nr:YbaB/EbfC family nucleoid-associated protein [Carnobacterium divergens]TFJ44952.1 YbaB/EbfC family nucleoid-associated protein [Carnobacterium divergens]TFJ51982.1 YbaB/EbfC family nucleoid-associated protein [Carnobacterium divergens]